MQDTLRRAKQYAVSTIATYNQSSDILNIQARCHGFNAEPLPSKPQAVWAARAACSSRIPSLLSLFSKGFTLVFGFGLLVFLVRMSN